MKRWVAWTAWVTLAACGGLASSPGDAGRAPDGALTGDAAAADVASEDGTVADGAPSDAGAGHADAARDAPASDGAVCPGPLSRCADACVDLRNDDRNCGACGAACSPGLACSQGACTCFCGVGSTACGAPCSCVDLSTDPNNCGGCGLKCPTGVLCTGGTCIGPCFVQLFGERGAVEDPSLGLVVCNGACIDPMTDNVYCGASGDCQGANAGVTCTSGHVCEGGVCRAVDAASD